MGSYLISLTSIEMMFMSAETERVSKKKFLILCPEQWIITRHPYLNQTLFFLSQL